MELLETLAKLFGLLIFYCFFFLLGGTFLCFMLLVAVAYSISSYFGIKKSCKVDQIDYEIKSDSDVYVLDTIVMYKKEEYPALVMYQMVGSDPDILSITNAQEDFTDILPPEEIARLTVEIEYNHVD
ncbi:hypothetical protein D3C73_976040 [compost metagenome]